MDEAVIRLHVEPLGEGGDVATSPDVPGLVAEGRSIVETVEIAQGLAQDRRIVPGAWRPAAPALLNKALAFSPELPLAAWSMAARSMTGAGQTAFSLNSGRCPLGQR